MINRGQIKKDEHFQKIDNGGVYLNCEGKKLFIEAFENKMATKIVVKGKQLAYRQLMYKYY